MNPGSLFPTQEPRPASSPVPGVAVVKNPETSIRESIHASVSRVLGELPPDAKGAIVGVGTTKGVNLAIAYKLDSGWDVAAWIGKSGWNDPVEGGVVVQKVWK